MEKINQLYNELLSISKTYYGRTHGLQILHKGLHTDKDSILFVGRENRGHGNKIENFKDPISGFITNDFKWLNDSYKYSGSPFWRVIGKSLNKITGEPYNADIFEKIYWTNIFKISPYQRRPNTKRTRDFQAEICQNLLLEEITFLKPRAVVFLTDYWVNDYLEKWAKERKITTVASDQNLPYHNKSFEFLTEKGPVPAIVLPHPQNKKSGASENELINHIFRTI